MEEGEGKSLQHLPHRHLLSLLCQHQRSAEGSADKREVTQKGLCGGGPPVGGVLDLLLLPQGSTEMKPFKIKVFLTYASLYVTILIMHNMFAH